MGLSERQQAEYETRQADYEKRYFERMERQRPKAPAELHVLRNLAEKAVSGDGAAAIDFVVKCTPENLLLALDADAWDERNPFYSCRECKDGAELPEGYVCQVCGTNNPGSY